MSSVRLILAFSRYCLSSTGGRSFSVVAPKLWNSLPGPLGFTNSLSQLKTLVLRMLFILVNFCLFCVMLYYCLMFSPTFLMIIVKVSLSSGKALNKLNIIIRLYPMHNAAFHNSLALKWFQNFVSIFNTFLLRSSV